MGGTAIVGDCISAQGYHLGVLAVLGANADMCTTSGSGNVSSFTGSQSLAYSGSFVPTHGWVSLPVTGGTAILAINGNTGSALSNVNLIAVINNDGTFGTSGAYAAGATITQWSKNGSGTSSFGRRGGDTPRTRFSLRDLDIRSIGPSTATYFNTAAIGYYLPAIVDLGGWNTGDISNVGIVEVNRSGGAPQHKIGCALLNVDTGADADQKSIRGVVTSGGFVGTSIYTTHLAVDGLTASNASYDSSARGIDIAEDAGNTYRNLQAHTCSNGLGFEGPSTYWAIIESFHFEACGHLLFAKGSNGKLKIRRPIYDSPSVADPAADIAATKGASQTITVEDTSTP